MRTAHFTSIACFVLGLAWAGNAEVPFHACEPDNKTFALIDQWRTTSNDATRTFNARMVPLWKEIEAQPGNVFLHLAYQENFRNYIESVRMGAVEEGYRKLIIGNPTNLPLTYAYARLLNSGPTAERKKMLEQVIETDPNFPWAHLELARFYLMDLYKDDAKFREETGRFFELCPGTLAGEAYEGARLMPNEFRAKMAVALRARVKDADKLQEFAILPTLWKFEFQGGAEKQEKVRAEVATDLARVRKLAGNNLTSLSVALEGYNLVGDQEGARWARERIARTAGHSFKACDVAMIRWYADRTRPTVEDSRQRVQGYYHELLDATDQWIQICPLYETPWNLRFQALRELPEESVAKVLQTGEGLLRASQANSSNRFVAPSIPIGQLYEKRGTGFERIPALVERDRRDSEARLASDRKLDWLPKSWKERNELDVSESNLIARVLLVRKDLHEGKRELATSEMNAAESDAARLAGEQMLWALQPHLVEGYLALNEPTKAAAHLDVLKKWLDDHKPGEAAGRNDRIDYSDRQSTYWELTGALAELKKQPDQAVMAYQNALTFRSNWETIADRFALIDKTATLWNEIGGTPEDWDRWLSKTKATVAVPAHDWKKIEHIVPTFTLLDLGGRKWTQDSLKGKVTLINMWATWCGPCIAELPYVLKIQEAVRDRKDVQVITLNVDENPGLIEPFLKQRGTTALTVIPAMDFVLNALQVNGFPRTWIVDRDGVARREQAGFTGEPSKWVDHVVSSLK